MVYQKPKVTNKSVLIQTPPKWAASALSREERKYLQYQVCFISFFAILLPLKLLDLQLAVSLPKLKSNQSLQLRVQPLLPHWMAHEIDRSCDRKTLKS